MQKLTRKSARGRPRFGHTKPKSTNKNYYFMVAVVTEVEAASLG